MTMPFDPHAVRHHEARLNVTFDGRNADLPEPIPFAASDAEIKAWAREAIAAGALGAPRAGGRVDLTGFVIDRFPATAKVPENRVFLRPITPFG